MAMRDLPADIERECMGMMLADSERLTQLIDRILGAARIDRKRKHYSFEPTGMSEFIQGVLESDRHLFEKEGHTIVFEPGRDARVFVDRASMHIVLSNLIENAADKRNKSRFELVPTLSAVRLFDGMMDPKDKLHPTLKTYQIWADALKPVCTELLGPPGKEDLAPPATGDPSARPPG